MLDRILNALEPFALTVVVLAGASLSGWVEFSNRPIVGFATVVCGILLIGKHMYQTVKK